jgi:UDP-N-acetylglucosamine pyrophosphorylase
LLSKSAEERGSCLYHKAEKKVDYYDVNLKQQVKVTAPNAIKFELFVQNFLRNITIGKLGVIAVQREDEFAPVKNADLPDKVEVDSPASARNMLLDQASRWLKDLDFEIAPEAEAKIEISHSINLRDCKPKNG